MKKKFSFGVIAGIASLILVPLLASAASRSSAGSQQEPSERPIPSQECLQAQVAKHDLLAADLEETMAARKAAMQAHRDALAAAAAISDDTQRQAAVQQAQEAFRTAMQNFMPSKSDEMQAAMEAVRTACGDAGGRGGFGLSGGSGGGFGGPMMGGKGMRGMHRGSAKGPSFQNDLSGER